MNAEDEKLGDELFKRCLEQKVQETQIEELIEKRVAATGTGRSSILAAILSMGAAYDRADVVSFCVKRKAVVAENTMNAIASCGSFASHRVLIEANAVDINYCTEHHGDMLMAAACRNDLEWARFCLDRGADPNLHFFDGYESIMGSSARDGFIDMVELLLERGAVLDGSGAVVLAAEGGQTEMVRLLLEKGADINEFGLEDVLDARLDERTKEWVGTPLHRAIANGHVETATFLMEAGAGLELPDFMGRTPMVLAELGSLTEIENDIAKRLELIDRPSKRKKKGVTSRIPGVRVVAKSR